MRESFIQVDAATTEEEVAAKVASLQDKVPGPIYVYQRVAVYEEGKPVTNRDPCTETHALTPSETGFCSPPPGVEWLLTYDPEQAKTPA